MSVPRQYWRVRKALLNNLGVAELDGRINCRRLQLTNDLHTVVHPYSHTTAKHNNPDECTAIRMLQNQKIVQIFWKVAHCNCHCRNGSLVLCV